MKKSCKLLFFTATGAALSLASAFAAPAITLDQYLNEVSGKNPGIRASEASAKGYADLSDSASVLSTPYLFGNYTNLDDRRETTSPTVQGTRTTQGQYTVGVGMNTRFGLNAKYSFNTADTEIFNASAVPIPRFNTSYNKLELTQSILKNGFGSQTRAQEDAQESENLAQSYAARFNSLSQLVEAENAYWRLAFARRSVEIQKDALARAQRALDWAKRRVNMQLGDKSDLLQAQASYDLRRLELSAAEEEERNAARSFNTLRYIDDDKVSEALRIPTIEETIKATGAEKAGTRLDIKAAEEQAKAAAAKAQLAAENVKPSLDLFATLSWNGKDAERGEAVSEAFKSAHSANTYGVNLTIPLDLGSMTSGIRGARYVRENAELALEQQKLNESLSWREVESRFNEARTRLSLLRTIENVQKEKYENERQRLLRGRTTTYQALTFEQEYAQTQLSTLRTQNEVLQIRAQMKLYRGEQ
jgi:outer membrane protein TolC